MFRDGTCLRVVNCSRGTVLAKEAAVAAKPWSRMRGLLGRRQLEPGQGLLIVPCQGVHTIGMAFPIDVLHLDREGVVRRVLHRLKPWRIGPLVRGTRMVLE